MEALFSAMATIGFILLLANLYFTAEKSPNDLAYEELWEKVLRWVLFAITISGFAGLYFKSK